MRCVSSEERTANVRLRGGEASESARIEHEEDTHVLINVTHERQIIELKRRLLRMLVEARLRRKADSGELTVCSWSGRDAREGQGSADAARHRKEMTMPLMLP
jgi:hypothetical protein